jgi:hypothetical protein
MALNTDPNFPPSGNPPYAINREWCLGDSLFFLNRNFENFDNRLISLNTLVASTSSTVVTTLSTVPYARLNAGNQTGPAPIYGCRAWVNFQGRGSNGVCTIRNGGNVASVSRISDGRYQINFQINMLGTNYVVLGNASRNNNPSNIEDTSIMPYDLSESSFTISLLDATNNTVVNDSFIYLAVIA